MNCKACEPLIALYAGADLGHRDAASVEEHLAECAGCGRLLEDLRTSQAALRELASEPVDAALLAAVRSGVMAEIGKGRRLVWPWVAALAAAAALVGGLVVTPRKAVKPLQPPAIVQAPRRVIADLAIEVPPAVVRRRVVRRPPSVKKQEQPLVVKMLTDDPDIVIIWLVDQRGD